MAKSKFGQVAFISACIGFAAYSASTPASRFAMRPDYAPYAMEAGVAEAQNKGPVVQRVSKPEVRVAELAARVAYKADHSMDAVVQDRPIPAFETADIPVKAVQSIRVRPNGDILKGDEGVIERVVAATNDVTRSIPTAYRDRFVKACEDGDKLIRWSRSYGDAPEGCTLIHAYDYSLVWTQGKFLRDARGFDGVVLTGQESPNVLWVKRGDVK